MHTQTSHISKLKLIAKKISTMVIFLELLLLAFLSCGPNPTREGVITQDEYNKVKKEYDAEQAKKAAQGIFIVTFTVPKDTAAYIKFSKAATDDTIKITDASSKDWHIRTHNGKYLFGTNSGTTATETNSSGMGGLKIWTSKDFIDVESYETEGGTEWTVDENLKTSSATYSGNRYMADRVYKETAGDITYYYAWDWEYINSKGTYRTSTNVYIVKDGNGGNYVKFQATAFAKDGNNYVYTVKFQMANELDNTFPKVD